MLGVAQTWLTSTVGNAVTGDFGPSYIYKDNTVAELIGKGLPYSMELGFYALLLALIGGVTVGIGVGDLLISVIGTGPWQLAFVVAIAMSVAILADRGPLVPMQAASSGPGSTTTQAPSFGAARIQLLVP